MSTILKIKAKNLEEAIDKAEKWKRLPRKNSEYVDESFHVNIEAAHDINDTKVIDAPDYLHPL